MIANILADSLGQGSSYRWDQFYYNWPVMNLHPDVRRVAVQEALDAAEEVGALFADLSKASEGERILDPSHTFHQGCPTGGCFSRSTTFVKFGRFRYGRRFQGSNAALCHGPGGLIQAGHSSSFFCHPI